ncbi:hypothetical protein V6N13_083023 [Hibiscus sabdariffa]|uniref:Uncharacterized protein n=1 Tax=Hibiscus sabdariffa TaxID=183260 RepID=A0ABR2N760_9ROSI
MVPHKGKKASDSSASKGKYTLSVQILGMYGISCQGNASSYQSKIKDFAIPVGAPSDSSTSSKVNPCMEIIISPNPVAPSALVMTASCDSNILLNDLSTLDISTSRGRKRVFEHLDEGPESKRIQVFAGGYASLSFDFMTMAHSMVVLVVRSSQ